MGVDTHLKIAEVLKNIPIESDLKSIQDYICPLLARNKEEQKRFEGVFKNHAYLLGLNMTSTSNEIIIESTNNKQPQKAKKIPRLREYLAPLFLLAVMIGFYPYVNNNFLNPIVGCMDSNALNYDVNAKKNCLNCCEFIPQLKASFEVSKKSRLRIYNKIRFNNLSTEANTFLWDFGDGNVSNIKNPTHIYTRSGNYEVTLKARNTIDTDTFSTFLEIRSEDAKSDSSKDDPDKKQINFNIPFERSLIKLPKNEAIDDNWKYQIYQNKFEISWLLAFLIGLIWLAIILWKSRKNKIIKLQRGDEPPYSIPIKIQHNEEIDLDEKFYTVLNQMRGRRVSERQQLNISKTIASTIRKGGQWDFQYTPQSKPTDYLILIDKNNDHNHQAQLFEHIYWRLKKSEVYVERFFFDGDPQLCWNKEYSKGVKIDWLIETYQDARLMIMSDGYNFINQMTGELEPWIKSLKGWNDRVLLTPASMGGWNYRESILAQFFIVLPANLEGMLELVSSFEGEHKRDLRFWKYFTGKNDPLIEIDDEQIEKQLNEYFSEDLQKWIAACAVYPELHWDLTIRIGQEFSTPDNNLLTYSNITKLARLKWFQVGQMPLDIRKQLLGMKSFLKEDLQKARQVIVEILEKSIPENRKSYAAEEHKLHLAVNKLLLNQVNEDSKRWLKQYREQIAKGVSEDHVMIQELDKKYGNALSIMIPTKFRDYFFNKGRNILGIKKWVNLSGIGIIIFFLFLGQYLWVEDCYDKAVAIDGKLYCSQTSMVTVDSLSWNTENFADIGILRYKISHFDKLNLDQKKLVYFLTQAGLAGRDIIYDQNYRHNLTIRRALEHIVKTYKGNRNAKEWNNLMTYVKRVWFANGIHHHYSMDKFTPGFSQDYMLSLLKSCNISLADEILDVIFNPDTDNKKVNLNPSIGLVKGSAVNFYDPDITEAEVDTYYEANGDDSDEPISSGLNSKLVRLEDGTLSERIYMENGLYGEAIKEIIKWLEKAVEVAENAAQENALKLLIEFYQTGDLKKWDAYNIAWVETTEGDIDYVNGFIEVYNDPKGYTGSYESTVEITDFEAAAQMKVLADNAQWFEDNSTIDKKHKKKNIVGVSYKVVTVAGESGDASPSSPIGISLPNANWIRAKYGSKSKSLGNIIEAYANASGPRMLEEFAHDEEEVTRALEYGARADKLSTALHEVIGHASGKLEEGVGTPKETLRSYASTIEEARADLIALYFIMDPKMYDLGLLLNVETAKAEYDSYISNGLMKQLRRIELGRDIEESHMRNRQLISAWVYEKGQADNVIEKVSRNGKTYFNINDYDKLHDLFGDLLRELQRIKSQGDYQSGRALVEDYGVKVDQAIHREVLDRTQGLNISPYRGFLNPNLVPVKDSKGNITDIQIIHSVDFTTQMLNYSEKYSFLPSN